MPKLRVRPDAPDAMYSVGPLGGDWRPGEARDLADLQIFDVDRNGWRTLDDEYALRIVAHSDGLVELVPDPAPDPAPAKPRAPKES